MRKIPPEPAPAACAGMDRGRRCCPLTEAPSTDCAELNRLLLRQTTTNAGKEVLRGHCMHSAPQSEFSDGALMDLMLIILILLLLFGGGLDTRGTATEAGSALAAFSC
jgi:hypothetical protein